MKDKTTSWHHTAFHSAEQSGRSPKVVALLSAINFSSYIMKLLQLQDKIQIKWNYAWIHYNIDIRRHLMIWKDVWYFIFGTKFSSIFLLHGKHSFGKVINEVRYQACDLMRFIQQIHISILHLCIWVPSFARGRLTNDSRKNKRFSPFAR